MESIDLTSSKIIQLETQDWFNGLIEDCKSTVVETEFTSRWIIVEGYHALGKRIVGEKENFTRSEIYGKNVIRVIAEKINRSESTVEKAVQFYEKYPDLSLLPEGKNTSWSKICKKYLPTSKKSVTTVEVSWEKEKQEQPEELPTILVNDLDIVTFTFRENLDLFLNIRDGLSSIDSKRLSIAFATQLKSKFKVDDIKKCVNEYAKGKVEKETTFLKDLETEIISTNNIVSENNNISPVSPSLFENTLPPLSQKTITKKEQPTIRQNPLPQLVSQYRELYKSKFNREPVISPTSWAKWGKLLKIKISQGYTISEIITLLQIFAKSKDSDKLAFDPSVLLSDFVFNKMLAIKSKSSNVVMEGKYGKF